MKITMQPDLEIEPVNLRRAWLMRRAWRPGRLSPISPSSSAFGVRAATESMTRTSTAPERTKRVGDFKRLLAGIGLRDQEIVDLDAELAGIDWIKGVFGVDEGADAAQFLGFGDAVERQAWSCRSFPGQRSR